MIKDQSLSRVTAGLNSKFFFSKASCHTKPKELSLPYLPMTQGRRDGFMPFTRVLAQRETPAPSFGI